MSDHKTWLDAEYRDWSEALTIRSLRDFREHPSVLRMMGGIDDGVFDHLTPELHPTVWGYVDAVDSIGFSQAPPTRTGLILRLLFYAINVLERQPPSIIEIGGAVGHFLALLVALGWRGEYTCHDLPAVSKFRETFLGEVEARTGLPTRRPAVTGPPFPFVCSFYALGEFDDETKARYINDVVLKSDHGLVVWNPHSGASPEIGFPCHVEIECPLTGLGNKLLTW